MGGAEGRRPTAPATAGSSGPCESISARLRFRLLPALLTAIGVALLATGLNSYTTAIQSPPPIQDLASYEPPPSLSPVVVLPDGNGVGPGSSFPADRVATRVVVRRLGIDLPVMLQTSDYGKYPLCDVAMYLPHLGQPGQGGATYLYGHAQTGDVPAAPHRIGAQRRRPDAGDGGRGLHLRRLAVRLHDQRGPPTHPQPR